MVADPLQQDRSHADACSSPKSARAEIAALSMAYVCHMSREELIALIQAVDIPLFREEAIEHLKYADRATLERLAFLAQRTVRNQMESILPAPGTGGL